MFKSLRQFNIKTGERTLVSEFTHSDDGGNPLPMLRRTLIRFEWVDILQKLEKSYESLGRRFELDQINLKECAEPLVYQNYDRNSNPGNLVALHAVALELRRKGAVTAVDAVKIYLQEK